ncbi:hypothetical protein EV424DRAFT_1539547 [Suillus variegatus]|nr:hypothetical protein EV424DRAFT_1539547 [Suillus variegatus]
MSDTTSTDPESRSSSFNDGADAILTAAGLAASRHLSARGSCALANALADVSERQGLERDINSWNTQVGGHSSDSKIRPLKRKRSMTASQSVSVRGTTPRCFGRNLTNVQRAQTVPALEVPKRRKLGKPFEFEGSTTRETSVLYVVKRLEAAIDRQTEVLSNIYRVLEGSAN